MGTEKEKEKRMKYAIRFLREELNRERSFEAGYLKSVAIGRKIKTHRTLEIKRRVEQHRIQSLMLAISVLKNAKCTERPAYYWQNPKR